MNTEFTEQAIFDQVKAKIDGLSQNPDAVRITYFDFATAVLSASVIEKDGKKAGTFMIEFGNSAHAACAREMTVKYGATLKNTNNILCI